MKKEYDFSKGTRGPVISPRPGTTRITIRLDDEVLDWFRAKIDSAGGGDYEAMMNDILREFIRSQPLPRVRHKRRS